MRLRALLAILALWLPALASAQDPPTAEFTGIRVGFGDRYKAGLWTPVELSLRGGPRALTGHVWATVADSDGVPCEVTLPEESFTLPPETTPPVTLYVRFGHSASTLRARFESDDGQAVSKTFGTGPRADGQHFLESLRSQSLIVCVGGEAPAVEKAASMDKAGGKARTVVAHLDDVGQLPSRLAGYEGVDAIVLSTSQSGICEKLAGTPARLDALDQWIRQGGRLVLSAGQQAGKVFGPGSPLARFLPGRMEKLVPLNQMGAFETYAKSSIPVLPPGGPAVEMLLPLLSGVQGRIEANEADLPLVVRSPHGFGQVVYLAGDLDRPPLRDWQGGRLLVARLLDLPAEAAAEEAEPAARYGFSDVAGQLRSALDQFSGVHVVPFYIVAIAAVLYALWIGPGDYFFLRRFARRMQWTWLTFPAVVVLLSAVAWFAAHRLKGDRLCLHQVDLVDVDAAGEVRGTTWFNLFSPRAETFNLSLAPRLSERPGSGQYSVLSTQYSAVGWDERPMRSIGGESHPMERPASGGTRVARPTLPDSALKPQASSLKPSLPTRSTIAWFGLPGEGLGGMYRAWAGASGLASSGEPYSISADLDSINDVPIPAWSSKSFTGRWTAACDEPCLQAALVDEDHVPVGKVASRLPFPLEHCILAYDRCAYDLKRLEAAHIDAEGRLAPGKPVEVGPAIRRVDLKTLLTGSRLSFDEHRLVQQAVTPYDPSSLDELYILQAMMFFDAAGGRRYTGLDNDYQRFVDLSGLLKAGRAVLVAYPAEQDGSRGAVVLRDGQPLAGPQDEHLVIYRFVLPVTLK